VHIYVDVIIFGSTNASLCKEFSKLMQDEFEISVMGELKFFLGIQINQSKDGVYVHQTKYTKELLKKFKLEDCKVMNTPMHPTCILSKEDTGPKVDQKLYRGMIGSLLYLTASRLDILFSVCLCARFQSDSRESHLIVVKRIFRYRKGTTNLGLLYRKSLDLLVVQFGEIQGSFRRKKTVLEHKYIKIKMTRELEGYVSRRVLKFIYDELKCSKTFDFCKDDCGCVHKTSCGLPCACILAMKSKKKMSLVLDDIFPH